MKKAHFTLLINIILPLFSMASDPSVTCNESLREIQVKHSRIEIKKFEEVHVDEVLKIFEEENVISMNLGSVSKFDLTQTAKQKDDHNFVIYHNNEIVGFSQLKSIIPLDLVEHGISSYLNKWAYIGFNFKESASGKGLASENLKIMIEIAKKMKLSGVYAKVLQKNSKSKKVFQKQGFKMLSDKQEGYSKKHLETFYLNLN